MPQPARVPRSAMQRRRGRCSSESRPTRLAALSWPRSRYGERVDQLEPTLLVIPLLAVLAPLLARSMSRWVRVPIVVFELVLGIIAGPAVLGWAQPSDFADALSEFGLAMLFFVAGSEIEFSAFRH